MYGMVWTGWRRGLLRQLLWGCSTTARGPAEFVKGGGGSRRLKGIALLGGGWGGRRQESCGKDGAGGGGRRRVGGKEAGKT